jgi:hypothetical protein
MGLIYPSGPSWAYYSHNQTNTLSGTTFGTHVTSGTSSADGTAVTLLSALAHDVEYLSLKLGASSTPAIDNNALMDILIDPAAGTSWSVLIPSLAVAGLYQMQVANSAMFGPSGGYDFPIWIPAGASIGAQARNAGTTLQTLSVLALAKGGNANPASWWCGQRVSAIGINAGTSHGSSVSTGATTNVYGSWADFGSTLGEACGAVQWAVMGDHSNGAVFTSRQYEFEFGVGGVRYGGSIMRAISSSENGFWIPTGPIFSRFAAGTQFQARGKGSASGAVAMSVAAWAVY